MKHLTLITSGFPYGNSETFLESEIHYLAKAAEKVTIYVPFSVGDKPMRAIPNNCQTKFYQQEVSKGDKARALGGIFSPLFWNELRIIKKEYGLRLNSSILSILLIALYQAKRLKEQFKKDINPRETDILFYSYWADETAIALAMLRSENPTIKCISRVHRWDVYFDAHSTPYLPLRKYIARELSSIVSISEDGIRAIKEEWKVDNMENIKLSRLGVKSIGKLEFQFPKEEGVLRLVSCSNVIPVKRVGLIAEALKLIDFPVEWTHFGDGRLMEELKEQVKQLPANITVDLKGRIPNTEIYENYQKIQPHLFINVSESEGVPVSLMEAMSFGIPCIATDVGGNAEIVNSDNGVLLVAHPSAKEIASTISRYTEMENTEYINYVNNAFSTWKEDYNQEVNYNGFVEMLKELK